jgi:hypothetical protein
MQLRRGLPEIPAGDGTSTADDGRTVKIRTAPIS